MNKELLLEVFEELSKYLKDDSIVVEEVRCEFNTDFKNEDGEELPKSNSCSIEFSHFKKSI